MAKAKKEKVVEEEIIEEKPTEKLPEKVIFEAPLSNVMEQGRIVHPVYVPDMPSQMDDSIPENPKGETEIEFLQRVLHKQHDGGFGRHLDEMINERIKELRNVK